MSIKKVREYFKTYGLEERILEFPLSSATVQLAALALQVDEARIAKTLSFKTDECCNLIVTAGDTKIDNAKYKKQFKTKAKMLTAEEALTFTGHMIGGVCPFGIENSLVNVYLDKSLQRFESVFPACGSSNSAIELTLTELEKYSQFLAWIDVSKPISEN